MDTTTLLSPQRRRYLFGIAAGVAALSGAGLAWRHFEPQMLAPGVENALWEMVFTDLNGKPLPMRTFQGRPLLINFWASWCPPCVAELPLLSDFFNQNSANGWQVLGLAVDQLNAVQQFLSRAPVSFPIALAGMEGIDLSKSLGNAKGSLPFTVVLGPNGNITQRKIGQLSADDLRRWSAQT